MYIYTVYTVPSTNIGTLDKMSKAGCENKSALFILLISVTQNIHKVLTYHWSKTIESGGKSHDDINVFLQWMLATIIGTPRNSYE